MRKLGQRKEECTFEFARELVRTAASGDQELATRGKSTEERTSFGLCEKWAETCTIGRPKLENSWGALSSAIIRQHVLFCSNSESIKTQ